MLPSKFHPTATSFTQFPLSEPTSREMGRRYRTHVWNFTEEILKKGWYWPYKNNKTNVVKLPPIDFKCIPYFLKDQTHQQGLIQEQFQQAKCVTTAAASSAAFAGVAQNQPVLNNKKPLNVRCVRGDCLDIARELYIKYNSPAMIFDAANASHPGGGYRGGCAAQEESLCRCSSLAFQIDPKCGEQKTYFYPLNPKHDAKCDALFVPNGFIFRGGPSSGYAMLPQPFSCHFAVLAATNGPQLVRGNVWDDDEEEDMPPRINDIDADKLMTALRTSFRMAAANNVRSIVTVAVGAGAFGNPSEHVAAMMCFAIQKECPNTSIEEVVISLFDDHNSHNGSQHGNAMVFAQTAASFFPNIEIVDLETNEDLKELFCTKKIPLLSASWTAEKYGIKNNNSVLVLGKAALPPLELQVSDKQTTM